MCQLMFAVLLLPACQEHYRPVTAAEQAHALRVDIAGGDGITLTEFQGDSPDLDEGSWKPICRTPCIPTLYPGRYYRVEGAGRSDSTPVQLPFATAINGVAKGGSSIPILIGSTLIVAGAAGLVMTYAGLGRCTSDVHCSDSQQNTKSALIISGVTLMVVGPIAGYFTIQYGRETSLEFTVVRLLLWVVNRWLFEHYFRKIW